MRGYNYMHEKLEYELNDTTEVHWWLDTKCYDHTVSLEGY